MPTKPAASPSSRVRCGLEDPFYSIVMDAAGLLKETLRPGAAAPYFMLMHAAGLLMETLGLGSKRYLGPGDSCLASGVDLALLFMLKTCTSIELFRLSCKLLLCTGSEANIYSGLSTSSQPLCGSTTLPGTGFVAKPLSALPDTLFQTHT